MISLLRARSRSHIALRRAALRAGLNLRRFFLALIFLRKAFFSKIKFGRVPFPLGLSPFAPELLFSRGGFGIPLPRRPVRLPFLGRIWCLLADAPLSFRFPKRCCLFAVAVGTDGSGRRLNNACVVNTIGAVLLTDHVTPVASSWCRSPLVDPRPRFASRLGSTPAVRQPWSGPYGISAKSNIPGSPGVDLGPRREGEPGGNEEFPQYRALVDSLMWLSVMTRPDIANTLRACTRHSYNPSPRH